MTHDAFTPQMSTKRVQMELDQDLFSSFKLYQTSRVWTHLEQEILLTA